MMVFRDVQPLAGNMNAQHVRKNIAISSKLGLPEALEPRTLGRIGSISTTVCIVNPGPSAKTPEVLEELNRGVDEHDNPFVIVLAGTGYNMLNHGLERAHAFVASHPESLYVKAIPTLGDHQINYFIASMAPAGADPENPSVFKHLMEKGRTPRIWHAHMRGVTEFDRKKVVLGTGSGATIAALVLYVAMGYRNFRVYGMDGSAEYAARPGRGAAFKEYLKAMKKEEKPVRVGDKIFSCNKTFWAQTKEMMRFMNRYPQAVLSIKFSGDTANAAIFNSWQNGKFTCGPVREGAAALRASPLPSLTLR